MTLETKRRLINEYITLTGQSPSKEVNKSIVEHSEMEECFAWQMEDDKAVLRIIDPFGIPEDNLNFGADSEPDKQKYAPTPFDSGKHLMGEVKREIPIPVMHKRMLQIILPENDREKLLQFHDSGDFNSSKKILDGFGIDRLIECYAEGIEDESISKYLRLRPSQLKRWIAISNQRILAIQKLQGIMRKQNINAVIGEAFDFKLGEVFDKADAAYQSLRVRVMEMKKNTAMELENRDRVKEQGQSEQLPVVQFGIQLNVNTNESTEVETAYPVLPGLLGQSDD